MEDQFIWQRPNKMEQDLVVTNMKWRFLSGAGCGLLVVFMLVIPLLLCYSSEVDKELDKICEEELGYEPYELYKITHSEGDLQRKHDPENKSEIQIVRDEHFMVAIIHNSGFFVLICIVISIYAAYIIIRFKRIRKCARGDFLVMHGKCYDKKTEHGIINEQTINYYVFLGQNENSNELYQAQVSEEDFNRSEMGSEFIAVRIQDSKILNKIDEEWETIDWAYLCESIRI